MARHEHITTQNTNRPTLRRPDATNCKRMQASTPLHDGNLRLIGLPNDNIRKVLSQKAGLGVGRCCLHRSCIRLIRMARNVTNGQFHSVWK
jgi:hypothetical protein